MPRGLLDTLRSQQPVAEPPRGLLNPRLYGRPGPAETADAPPAWQRAARDFSIFTDNYAVRPIADALAASLGLPGDAYLAASKLYKIDLGRTGDTLVYRNPTEEQMKGLAQRDKYNTIGWMRMPDGDVYVWPGTDSWHDNMAQLLGYDAIKDRGGQLLENGKLSKLTEMP
jgi:hypothetical protein